MDAVLPVPTSAGGLPQPESGTPDMPSRARRSHRELAPKLAEADHGQPLHQHAAIAVPKPVTPAGPARARRSRSELAPQLAEAADAQPVQQQPDLLAEAVPAAPAKQRRPRRQRQTVTADAAVVVPAERLRPRSKRGVDRVTDYATDVLSGAIVAGPYVRQACERHLRDLDEAGARGWVFDLARAQYMLGFFEGFLKLNGGEHEGRPFLLEPWQAFIVGSLFGWVSQTTGLRRFQTAYAEIGKGNGKSPLAAGIGLAGLIADAEPRAEIYAAATKKDQAMILFRDAVAMVNLSPELHRRIVQSGTGEKVWNLAYPPLGAWFKPISSDDGQSGPRPHVSLVDELHEHRSAVVVDMLRAGFKGRRQPLLFEITNSGSNRESVCWAHRQASLKALVARPGQQGFDDRWFAYICALDIGDDWTRDRGCWAKANPNLGVSVHADYLEQQVLEARNIPSRRNVVARLNFCEWTDAEQAWIGAELWMRAEVPGDREALRGRRAYLGIDLSKRRDLTAVAWFVPDDAGGGDAFVEFWTPADTLAAREEVDQVEYRLWRDQGHLNAVPGQSLDYGPVVRRTARICSSLELEVELAAFDRSRIDEFKAELEREDYALPLQEFGQGFVSMGPAIERLENLLLNGRLRIHYNPVLRWNASSVVTEENHVGDRRFTKRKATGRIDGIVALAMAVGVAHLEHKGAPVVHEQAFVDL